MRPDTVRPMAASHRVGTTLSLIRISIRANAMALLPGERLARVEEAYIELTLRYVSNNIGEAAALLGVSPRTVRNRIADFKEMRGPLTRADIPLRLAELGAAGKRSIAEAKGAGA